MKTINLLIYLGWRTYNIREFKEPRRRRRGQLRLKNEFRGMLKSFTMFITVKTITKVKVTQRYI